MTKALYPLIILAPIVAACIPIDDAPTCGPVAAVEVIYTKEGFPIKVDDGPIPEPCDVLDAPTRKPPTNNPPEQPKPPVVDPEPPTPEKVKGNNGWGNGDQDAPANSEFNNNAENRGGNHNGHNEAPANSWHGD